MAQFLFLGLSDGANKMDDWEIVSIEAELDRMRDEREKESQSAPTTGATGTKSKTGCLMSIVYFMIGISLLRLIGELLSIFF